MKKLIINIVDAISPMFIAAASVFLFAQGFECIGGRVFRMRDVYMVALGYVMGGTLIVIGSVLFMINAIKAMDDLYNT